MDLRNKVPNHKQDCGFDHNMIPVGHFCPSMNLKALEDWVIPKIAILYCGHDHEGKTSVNIRLPIDATEGQRDIVWEYFKKGERVDIARPFNTLTEEWEVRACSSCCDRYTKGCQKWKVAKPL